VDSEFACSRVSKLLLEVAIDLGLNLCKNLNSLLVDLFALRIGQVKSFPGFLP